MGSLLDYICKKLMASTLFCMDLEREGLFRPRHPPEETPLPSG